MHLSLDTRQKNPRLNLLRWFFESNHCYRSHLLWMRQCTLTEKTFWPSGAAGQSRAAVGILLFHTFYKLIHPIASFYQSSWLYQEHYWSWVVYPSNLEKWGELVDRSCNNRFSTSWCRHQADLHLMLKQGIAALLKLKFLETWLISTCLMLRLIELLIPSPFYKPK